MIAEVIGKKGEKGSGGGRDAFRPGVTYVCAKAMRIELLNLNSRDWRDARGGLGFSTSFMPRSALTLVSCHAASFNRGSCLA